MKKVRLAVAIVFLALGIAACLSGAAFALTGFTWWVPVGNSISGVDRSLALFMLHVGCFVAGLVSFFWVMNCFELRSED